MVVLMLSVSGKGTVKKNTRLESRKFGPQAKSLISFVTLGKSTSPVLSVVILQVKLMHICLGSLPGLFCR